MSNEQTAARHSALTLAVQYAPNLPNRDVLVMADLFLAFLNGGDAAVKPAATKPAPAAKPAAVAKPVPKKAAVVETAVESEPEVETDEAPTATDKEVGEALGAMLAADKREEAVALMGKFGAKSKSTLDKKFYAAFVAQANEILLTA